MAIDLPPDLIPAFGTALSVGTSVALIVVTSIYYAAAGVYNRTSALFPTLDTVEDAS